MIGRILDVRSVMDTSFVYRLPRGSWTPWLRVIGILAALVAPPTAAGAEPAAALRKPSAPALERTRETAFDRSLSVESTELDNRLEGRIYAVVDHPFSRAQALANPAHWCELLPLLPNIRHCDAASDGRRITLRFARRFDQSLADTHTVSFDVRVPVKRRDRLEVTLRASQGPFGTSDYRLQLAVAPVGHDRVSLQVRYGYAYGPRARMLAQAYVTTRGRDKVGFTVVGTADDGGPEYIGGLRGAVERNAMRLYLAIDAYLDALDEAGEYRRERSLRAWLAAIARYPRQLAEADPVAYFEAKRARL
jgi:hypothetical protein